MGARRILKRSSSTAWRNEEYRTLATIIVAVAFPLILTFILVGADMRSDLSDLKPLRTMDHATILMGWPDLETRDSSRASTEPQHSHSRSRVRMLGYMMNGYNPSREGGQVTMFILMPDAGHFLHPAHRIPNEMVEIWLNEPVPFRDRSLVWATGLLARNPGEQNSGKASFAMLDAGTEPAVERDITRWFKP